MKKIVFILLAGIASEIVAMESTGSAADATSKKATEANRFEGLPEVLANLTKNCEEGTLTLEMADSVLTGNSELNKKRLGKFVEQNFSSLNLAADYPSWNYTDFEELEDAYVGLLFIYHTDTTSSSKSSPSETRKALEAFVRQNNGTIYDFLSKGRHSNVLASRRQALVCLRMLGVICSNIDETRENLAAQRELESKLQALESGQSSININNNNNNNAPTGNEPADKSGGSKPNRNSGSSFFTLPRVLLTTGLLALAGYYAYTRSGEDKRK